MRERLPDGTFFEFDVTRMMNAATWSGTRWIHDTVNIRFKKSRAQVPCRGAVNEHTERFGPYSVVVRCDASRVPAVTATGPLWAHPGPSLKFVDAAPPG